MKERLATRLLWPPRRKGLTLLELILVIALVGILAGTAIWGSRQLTDRWRLKRAGHQLHDDLKSLQARAEMSGNLTLHNGALVTRRTFLVFDLDSGHYTAYQWLDRNGSGAPDAEEADSLWQTRLPPGISYGAGPGINRRACSNTNAPPGQAVSFSSPAFPPCNDRPCVKFDQHGFSVMGPGAIYLNDGERSLAISVTRPGHFTVCEWHDGRWR